MKTETSVALLQLVQTLVRAAVGLLLGLIGTFAVLAGLYQLPNTNFSLFSGYGLLLVAGLVVGALMLRFSFKLLGALSVRRQAT